ncbi:putative nuclease HARBI1 isoform X1 [Rhizophagus clarus]|nr:putative nuclease HARBI1 isoform X1 [Rhizophagus clarus]GET01295.1 putative nuclease HARBI1 isoform X1 [Rhizophagus clarus]GET01758.1 putative nuclease HARBI1 isoform X1 [Rhizophagus clarus]GET02888.1 putative nuclease HARBI1 isoform X1 [Rhizophagus clarus]
MRNAPSKDPEVYFTRKKRYAIHCQGIVNDKGDSAYPISPFLIPPFKDPSTRKYKEFNRFHSHHRVVVENAFGRLKARFRMLRDLDIKTVKMGVLFTCCAIILHNFLEINMDIWETNFNDGTDDTEEGDDNDDDNYMSDDVLRRTGQAKRNLIFHQHFS